MSATPSRSPQLEIAHVLFMDFALFSRLPMEQQLSRLEELQELVRGTPEFTRAEAAGEMLPIPTGDGMALVFFRDPVAAVQCAMRIARLVRERPHLRLRMGLHSGPVYRVADINANANVAGSGINVAERVVDCGDAGHILLSRGCAELLDQVGTWPLHDLGECEVKNKARLHLFNLYNDEVGNPELPEKLRPVRPAPVPDPIVESAAVPGPAPSVTSATGTRVVLLYKRNEDPDEQLLLFLERELGLLGYRVFIDRHLSIGVEWAKAIEREIRTADAVVPLVSQESIKSDMLAAEVEIAHLAAQEQGGRPRILPVRVCYTGPLPAGSSLSSHLDPLEYAVWMGREDNEALLRSLLNALQSPTARPASTLRGTAEPLEAFGPAPGSAVGSGDAPELEPVGGAVPLGSRFYVARPEDHQFLTAIARQDSIVLVKGARQMGKTSLLARGLQQAREAGSRWVLTDFQKLNAAQLESTDSLFMALGEWIADQLDLEVYPEEVWHARRGPSANFERYLRREVLGKIEAPIVWGLDEVDRLFDCSFASEVFGLFRSWHNERALDPTGPWARFTLAIAYALEAHLFITDVNQSPFNVGTRLTLEDFTFDQVADLNQRHASPLRENAEIARYYRLVSGHPYLVRRGLLEMATHHLDIATFEAQAPRDEWIFGDHLRRILVLLARDTDLCEIVRGILQGRPCPTPESFYRLRSAGVMAGDSARDVRPRCQLYATYLEKHLL